MHRISIISPIYYGKQYIPSLIRQAEAAGRVLGNAGQVELVLVNDAPDDVIDNEYSSEIIGVLVLNTDVNRGIQGARVWGLEHSKGDYILFLDQDDSIEPEYFISQLENIGDDDAVVCQVIHENKLFYNTDYPFERAVSKDYMLQNGNSIISPGQVLIRRLAIPEVWKNNIMKNNGADDFLLWLCMLGEGKTFALNEKIMFTHCVHYDNASWDSVQMIESEREMGEILKKTHVFNAEDENRLDRMLDKIFKRNLSNCDKFRKMFYVLSDWMTAKEKGINIADYLLKSSIRTVAIYGAGYLGIHLAHELENSEISVSYLIDKNARYIQSNYRIFTLDDELKKVDMVILTLVQGEQAIIDSICRKMNVNVITIKELIHKLDF